MTRYWCVNFNHDDCLQHGIAKNLWMMQYQYADSHGHTFQGDRKAAIQRNWKQLDKITAGDWFVAYLKRSTFYAIGKVITPRRPQTAHDFTDTIEHYLQEKNSHKHNTGYIYYTPVLYEDFTDKWSRPDDNRMRYPQRIDVERWEHYVSDGVLVKGLNRIKLYELQNAAFAIPKSLFDLIAIKLVNAEVSDTASDDPNAETKLTVRDAVVEPLEKIQAQSQGFTLDGKLRKALENLAMDAAKRHFRSRGYVVEDHSQNHPYDLRCTKGSNVLHVEVKGTQTHGEGVFLTRGEVEFANQHKGHMVLFLLHSIALSSDGNPTTGQIRVVEPWDVDHGVLTPMSYQYKLPTN
jgi:hypothetical protein